MITFPNAKINLGLNVVRKRPDGYHDLETIFYPIPLQDALEVTRRTTDDAPYTLKVSGATLDGTPDDNLVVRAYRLLGRDFAQIAPVDIRMYKHIPTGAGLGGGSSDAAAMIRLLNEKFALGLDDGRMEQYAAQLGADCPFFVRNRPVFATGVGDVFEPLDLSLAGYQLVLVKPDVRISTPEAYARIRPAQPAVSLRDVVRQPVDRWRESMHNDFEDSIFPLHPEIAAIKDKLYDLGAVYASMSGSGSAVYGLFRQAVENVEEKFCGYFCRQRALD